MANEHWFDELNKLVTHDAPRRGVLSAVAALIFGQRLDAIDAAAKKGGKGGKNNGKGNKGNSNGKKKGKKPKKPKKPPPPPPPCSEGACNREFVLEENRTWCELICRQCDEDDPRDFCIVKANPADPTNPMQIAVCCDEGETCCGAGCCPEGHTCCDGKRCCGPGETCCDGDCCERYGPYYTCCDGQCWNTEYAQAHCGACGNPCAAGEVCQAGQCLCSDDCGEDECLNCPPGQFCHDGITCSCGNGFKYCPLGEACIREEYECCGDAQSIIRYCFDGAHCCGSGVDVRCSPTPCP